MKQKRHAHTDVSALQGAAYPSQWKDFIAATKDREFSNAAAASRFAARYRIATGCRSTSFEGTVGQALPAASDNVTSRSALLLPCSGPRATNSHSGLQHWK